MHRTRLCAAILALAVASGACARGTVSGRSGGLEHPAGGSLVLRVETGGGFIAPQSTLGQVPEFSLFGDGRIITPGAQPAIYPGPALPNLLVQQVNEDGIQAILEGAREAGLLGPDARYDAPCISDQATTTFTVVADGRTHVVSAYALGNDSCNGQDAGARARLATFRARLGDLASWLPRGSIGQQSAYEPTEMRIYVQPLVPSAGQTLEQQPIDWPLAQPLATFGTPDPTLPELRCGVVRGDDLTALLPDARRANQLTPWRSGGSEYSLVFRPLLPDEHGC
ncbi:MAG TPA: hypothetical protein VFC04_01405 [Actinomycetota bacterium]|nr:hypothetical protein [Actinomycetota bacterium]